MRLPSCLILLVFIVAVTQSTGEEKVRGDYAATFSMVAYDPDARMWGVVVASKYLAVGSVVPWAGADVGAVATQSLVNVSWGSEGLLLLGQGKSPQEVLEILKKSDPGSAYRQIGLINQKGDVASFSGEKCLPWAGEKVGKHYSCQGNLLAGSKVLDEMARGFEESKGSFAFKLLEALRLADKAGGDKRGKQSAAILVVRKGAGPNGMGDRFLDLRVDDHPDPVLELIRIATKSGRAPGGK